MNTTLTTMPVRNGNHVEPRLPQFRVTVNARCGRACFFCRPSGEALATAAGMELKVDDLIVVAKVVRAAGVTSIKLTGGDPALYGPLEDAVLRLRREAGFDEVEVISRHPLIGERAERLAALGVTQFTMSVDTLDKRLHHELCGVDDLPELIGALQSCVKTGVPVKVNMVVMAGVNDGEVTSMEGFCVSCSMSSRTWTKARRVSRGGWLVSAERSLLSCTCRSKPSPKNSPQRLLTARCAHKVGSAIPWLW
jgi:molybdenum cofactor biosynthesis enzyme MoaA